MPEKKTKAPVYTTPAGEFVWPWLNKADDRPIKGKPQTPAYKLNLRYPANAPAWLKLKEKIDELVEASYDKAVAENKGKKIGEDEFEKLPADKQRKMRELVIKRQYPYSMDLDDEMEETGFVTFKLKQNASFKDKRTGEVRAANVAMFDAQLRPIDRAKVMVYGGSTGTASFSTRPYLVDSTNGAGISCDLKAVQVLNLVTSSQRSGESYGFEKAEGYEYDDSEEAPETVGEESTAEASETDATDF